jgi:hypothetical protein
MANVGNRRSTPETQPLKQCLHEKPWTENEISPTAINRTERQRLFNILRRLMEARRQP